VNRVRTLLIGVLVGAMVLPSASDSFTHEAVRMRDSCESGAEIDDTRVFVVANAIDSFNTLNPLLAESDGDLMTIWPCYSTLLTRDADTQIIGDLAVAWNLSSDGLVWSFKMSEKATFFNERDSASAHRVTARDVIYTYWLVQNQTASPLNSLLTAMNGFKVIERMWMDSDFQMNIRTAFPYAPLDKALATIPILPEYIWSQHAWNWANFDTDIAPCVGSGAFYHVELVGPPPLFEFSSDTYRYLYRSPTWFEEEERDWHVNVDQLVYDTTSWIPGMWWDFDTNVSSRDTLLNIPRSLYIDGALQSSNVTGWCVQTGLEYYLGINQMTTAMRTSLGGQYAAYQNNQLLLDPVVKRAIAMCINRSSIVNMNLSGLASVADSVIPEGNPWHASIDAPVQFDPGAARALLMTHGWAYASDGSLAGPSTTPLCRAGGADPLNFRFYVPYLPDSSDLPPVGAVITRWASDAGIALDTMYLDYPNLWPCVLQANHDIILHRWTFQPIADPSSDVMSLFTTMEIESGPWTNVIYYSNASFDSLYNESVATVDASARRAIVNQMQTVLYDDLSWQTICYVWSFDAGNTKTWTNYGNWSQQPLLSPRYALPWLYMSVYPAGDKPPNASFFVTPSSGSVDTSFEFDASATQDIEDPQDSLEVRWDWEDDGTWDTGWTNNKTAVHKYSVSGHYLVVLEARDEVHLTNKTSLEVIVTSLSADHESRNILVAAGVLAVAVGVGTTLFVFKRRRRSPGGN